MINEENLNKLYDGILEDAELTTKRLNGYGFNSKDLKNLIEDGNIERVKRGLYSLKSIDNLYYYGMRLITDGEYDKATLCFEKCFELDSIHLDVCLQLFLRSIQQKNYQKAFELYESLSQSENEFYSIDANYYLYLLSIITLVPENHREYARYLKYNDIKIPFTDKRYKDIQLQNKVRIAVLQRKFSYALKQLKDLITKHGNLTLQDIITRTLLFQAINTETTSKNTIVSLIKAKKYDEVVNHLLDKQDRHNLSISEEYILKLVTQYIKIQKSSNIPERKVIQAETLFEAIDTDNYNIALRLSCEYNEQNHISNDSNAINLLLNDICELINVLSKPKQVEEVTFKVEENKQTKNFNKATQSVATFSSIISYLMKNELDSAFYSLRSYMESIGKADFEFLIIDLIKISLLEKDLAFTKPMITLTLISKENYSFDISSYIQEFYITLSQNKFEEARIYLDIISSSNKLGQDCIITDGLYQVLESSEKILNYKTDNSVLGKVEKAIEDSKVQTSTSNSTVNLSSSELKTVDTQVYEQPILTNDEPIVKITSNIKANGNEITQEQGDSEKIFIEKKHNELVKNKGIILLRPMDDAKINRILKMIDEYSDMVAFVIGNGNQQQVVLRYKPVVEEFIDRKNLINVGNQAYKDGTYNECIKAYLQLLQLFNEPRAIVYSKLGLAYMKKWNIHVAIDYLTVANDLAKKENVDLDFTDLILRLKDKSPKEDAKPHFKMGIEEFDYDDVNNYYGIDHFEEINNFISNSGLDVESACKQKGMTDEQINIVKLIYAREFYVKGNFEKGDLFLRIVERSKNKTNIVIKLLNEIRKNKKFYQNRPVKNQIPLVLTLKPKK